MGTGDITDYVSDIVAVKGAKGGKTIEDHFDVASVDMVMGMLGMFNNKRTNCHGSLVFRDNNTAVMLVPPLDFKFRTKRQDDVARQWKTELLVTGHFMCLVDGQGRKGPRWAFDSSRSDYSVLSKHAYKIALATAMKELGPNVVPQRMQRFTSILL